MNSFQYKALTPMKSLASGQCSAETAADARASLRDLGLQVLTVRRVRPAAGERPLAGVVYGHLRKRRSATKVDLLEELATLLETGVPMVEAVDTLAVSFQHGSRALLSRIRETLRGGDSLSSAMRLDPGWFDGVDVAMATAGEHAGTLGQVLRSLAKRHARSDEVSRRVSAALAYPAVVLAVGLGVTGFLSNVTLPKLAAVLVESGSEVPSLTRAVMYAGQAMVQMWPVVVLMLAVSLIAAAMTHRAVAQGRVTVPTRVRRVIPSALRRAALAQVLREVALVLRCGVPLVEALRVCAPTAGGVGGASLRARLTSAAAGVEKGEDLSASLSDPLWFSASLRRSVAVGEESGELPDMLDRVAESEARRCRVQADRLAALLEPAAVLGLALLVGVVVMAAVQPLIRLQEVIR